MKAITQLLAIVVVAAMTALPSTAQHAQHHPDQAAKQAKSGMMQDGAMQGMHGEAMMQGGMYGQMKAMMQGMMQQPQMRAMMLTHALPVMQDSLGLTGDQVTRLHELQQAFGAKRDAAHQAMQLTHQRLQNLSVDDAAVEAALKEAAEQRTQMHLAALETAKAMRAVLTDAQREQIDTMPPMALHRTAMSSPSMMAMMQNMQDGAMSCPMMAMMKGGTMGSMQGNMHQQMQN